MEVRIIHVMADGTTRDSMKGVVVPLTPRTKRAYELLAQAKKEPRQQDTPEAKSS